MPTQRRVPERLRRARDGLGGSVRNLESRFDGARLYDIDRELRARTYAALIAASYALMIALPALVLAVLNYQARTAQPDD